MPFGGALVASAAIGGGSSIIGGLLGGSASKSAAKTQANAAEYVANLQQQQFNQTQANEQPWLQAGGTALSDLMQGLQPGGTFSTPYSGTFTPPDPSLAAVQTTPGYEFTKQQGEQAILNAQSASGGAFTGATAKNLDVFNQNLADTTYQSLYQQEFNNALNTYNTQFNSYNTNQSNLYNKLASVSGLGQTTATQLGQIGSQAINSIGNTITGGASATAAGQIGAANAYAGALGGVGSAASGYTNGLLLQQLMGGGYGGNIPNYNPSVGNALGITQPLGSLTPPPSIVPIDYTTLNP